MATETSDITESDTCLMRNFKLENEDHTLGTILTYILDRMPETEFCAYTVRHPTENVVYLRLKVKEGNDANDVFKKGVTELEKALGVIEKKFLKAVDTYKENSKRYVSVY